MNSNLSALISVTAKPVRNIIGLMAGTSLDGLDIALCAVKGNGVLTEVDVLQFKTVPYTAAIKEEIRKVFARDTISFADLCLLNPWIAGVHAEWILEALNEWQVAPKDVDLIASHGQTVYHCPQILHRRDGFPNSTLQIGDGDHIAAKTGILTVSDFRQKHIAAGGEGAPLALYGDFCMFSRGGENRVMLNLGGIANFTFLPSNADPSGVYVTDTGPGNTLIDAATRKLCNADYDEDARYALQGEPEPRLLAALKEDPFFTLGFPKTTGPELFSLAFVEHAQRKTGTENISANDLLATLTRFSADTVIAALQTVLSDQQDIKVYMSGGGARNPLLVRWISEGLPAAEFFTTEKLGIQPDAKEAVLFAILANETVAGQPIDFKRPGMPAVTMGKISFPG